MIFIDACFKKDTPYTPVWMMRQAGRYLPEYRAVRASAVDFISLCKNYKLASEVTLQPVDILDVDAAIIFSDILVVPMQMGLNLRFESGEGPVFDSTIRNLDDLSKLSLDVNLDYVYDALKLTREKLKDDKALIGFCGAPWTLATYMIEGRGSKNYENSKKAIYKNEPFMKELLSMLTQALKSYLENQIKSGANAVMIFDSWAGALESSVYLEYGFSYIKEICSYLKPKYPYIPIIVFAKGSALSYEKMDGDFDVFGVDWSTPIEYADKIIPTKYCLQGNMEPFRLYDKKAIDEGIEHIRANIKNHKHIFNLGHGITPDVPVENARYFIQKAQGKI